MRIGEGLGGVTELFSVLIVGLVTQMYTFYTFVNIVYTLKIVKLIVCIPYLNLK